MRARGEVVRVECAAEQSDSGCAIICGQDITGVRIQPIDELCRRHRSRESRSEAWALHKLRTKRLLVILEHCLPTCLAHDYALSNLLRVGQKLVEAHDWHCQLMPSAKSGNATAVTISGFVETLDQITCLLKFSREKVSSRNINTLGRDARLIRTTGSYLVRPES